MPKIEMENIFKQALSEGMNLFLGAGFSVLAVDYKNRNLPLGNTLKDEIIAEFGIKDLDSLPLDKICTILKSSRLREFNTFIKQRFTVKSFDNSYNVINNIKLGSIISSNVDNLIPKIFINNDDAYINDVTKSGTAYCDRQAINYIPLHGSVEEENPDFIFGTTELASAFSLDRDKWHYLTHALQNNPTLFWGYKVEDAGVLEALHPTTIKDRDKKIAWIILKSDNSAVIDYFRALNFKIIISDTLEMLDYLRSAVVKTKISGVKKFDTRNLFPEYFIPQASEVPLRPLVKFYGGEAPIWGDILTGRIHKTEYYDKVRDLILSSKNIIVTGLTASGKTTLMMQLASGISFHGHKLVCKDITKEKSDFIIKKLNGEKAIIFIDDFSNDIQALQNLIDTPNINVIGFERDYNFEIASHKIDEKKAKFINITALNLKDIQEIYLKIPQEVRVENLVSLQEEDLMPSLFEVIQLNTKLPKLKERFSTVIAQLEKESLILTNILVMLSYVHTCRTPVSFDMLYAFLRNVTSDYNEIYRLVEKLGNMVSEHVDNAIAIDTNQDYFVPRSTIIAEAILEQTPSLILKRVLKTFHNEVSSYRIYRYDVFRKKGYDANIILKAFSDWEEGKKFYEHVYNSDKSPYLRQQGALYLAKKKRYQEAFIWIDEALISTNYKVFSIRNSHAIILFKANIDKSESDSTVKETIAQSMKILSECYVNDKRKLYHALTFADQAIRYYEKFKDWKSKEYLTTAKKWLEEENKEKYSGYRNIIHLLGQVKKRILEYQSP